MPEYIDIPVTDDSILRVTYEMTIGDMLIAALLVVLIFFHVLNGIIRRIWRR